MSTTDVNHASYWQARYESAHTGWDLGVISPPLRAYFEQLNQRNQRILIVGAGNAHEASYLHAHGFNQVYVLDFAHQPLLAFASKHPDFPKSQLLCQDFFELDKLDGGKFLGFFDLIVEQTFFCAIDPTRRDEYAQQMQRLLTDAGKLVGVLFNRQFEHSPPFGGDLMAYRALFSAYFDIQLMDACYNSAPSRAGSELFIKLIKPSA